MQLKKLEKGAQITRKEIKSKLNDKEERMWSVESKATFTKKTKTSSLWQSWGKKKKNQNSKKPKNCINKKYNSHWKEKIINCKVFYKACITLIPKPDKDNIIIIKV